VRTSSSSGPGWGEGTVASSSAWLGRPYLVTCQARMDGVTTDGLTGMHTSLTLTNKEITV
jgi:hypothetical protein